MISLISNAPQFNNDISEEIRLFLGVSEIVFGEADGADFICKVSLEPGISVCELIPQNIKTEIPYIPATEALEKKRREKRAVKLSVFNAMQQAFSVNTPWGSLTGIRPTKLFREISAKTSVPEARSQFKDIYSVCEAKIDLLNKIHLIQAPIISSSAESDFDIYIGIPYCKTRCIYCSFGSELYKTDAQLREYIDALKSEISGTASFMRELGFNLRCSYFGGGTPTVLNAQMLDELLGYTEEIYGGLGREFTVEAGRPDTITKEKLLVLKKHNVSRISINPQTMNAATLRIIGRSHTPESIEECFKLARDCGFENINMDTIAGLPGETSSDFSHTLEEIEKLRPDSLTVHTLALKKSSPLMEKLDKYPLPSAEETEKMVRLGAESAISLGMTPYYMYRQKYMTGNLENVGYSIPGKECIYNIDMMEETVSVLAHGAHTISKRVFPKENRVERIANPKDVPTYFAKIPALLEQKKKAFSLTK